MQVVVEQLAMLVIHSIQVLVALEELVEEEEDLMIRQM